MTFKYEKVLLQYFNQVRQAEKSNVHLSFFILAQKGPVKEVELPKTKYKNVQNKNIQEINVK